MIKCSECEFSKPYNRLCVGVGYSAGRKFVATEYICKNPNLIKDVIVFKGKTSPRNCPLKIKS